MFYHLVTYPQVESSLNWFDVSLSALGDLPVEASLRFGSRVDGTLSSLTWDEVGLVGALSLDFLFLRGEFDFDNVFPGEFEHTVWYLIVLNYLYRFGTETYYRPNSNTGEQAWNACRVYATEQVKRGEIQEGEEERLARGLVPSALGFKPSLLNFPGLLVRAIDCLWCDLWHK